jgi:hypothetical protein
VNKKDEFEKWTELASKNSYWHFDLTLFDGDKRTRTYGDMVTELCWKAYSDEKTRYCVACQQYVHAPCNSIFCAL